MLDVKSKLLVFSNVLFSPTPKYVDTGLYSVAERLIALGVDLKATDIEGRTALHHASYHGKTDVIKLLIDAGCNMHAVSDFASG